MFGERGLRILAQVFIGLWVARYLGLEQFGLYSYVLVFFAVLGRIVKLGLDGIVVRDMVLYPNRIRHYLGTAFWLKAAVAFLMVGIIAIVTVFIAKDKITSLYILVVSIGLVFQSSEVIDFYFQSQVAVRFISLCKTFQLFASSILKIYLIISHKALFWFVLVILLDQITLAILMFLSYFYKKKPMFFCSFDIALAKGLLRDSWPLMLISLFIVIYMRIDQVMIRWILGDGELGVYSSAVRLSEASYFIPMIITTSLFPAILNAKKISQSLYYERLQNLYSLMIWAGIAIAILITFLSDNIVVLAYGEQFQRASNVLRIHVWASIFVFLGMANSKWFISENLQRYQAVNMIVGAIINIFLNLVLIRRYGIIGAAIATLVSQCFAGYLITYIFPTTRINFVLSTKAFNIFTLISRLGLNHGGDRV